VVHARPLARRLLLPFDVRLLVLLALLAAALGRHRRLDPEQQRQIGNQAAGRKAVDRLDLGEA